MDRLFLDANILFSAAYREGSGILRLWKLKRVKLLSSEYAVEEARRNLGEPHRRARLARLLKTVEIVRSVMAVPPALELPLKDEPILRAALAGRATHLVTGDVKHFGRYFGQRLEGVLVVLPAEYLRRRRRPGELGQSDLFGGS